MKPIIDGELGAFLEGRLDPASFNHGAHIRVAKALLEHHEFLEAAWIYDQGLGRITKRAGVEAKRSVTRTLAFLSIIAETGADPERNALSKWYSPERLDDPVARESFLMPDTFREED